MVGRRPATRSRLAWPALAACLLAGCAPPHYIARRVEVIAPPVEEQRQMPRSPAVSASPAAAAPQPSARADESPAVVATAPAAVPPAAPPAAAPPAAQVARVSSPPPAVAAERPAPVPVPVPVPRPAEAPAAAAPPNDALSNEIYFGVDAYKVSPAQRTLLAAHARRLRQSPALHVSVVAHADRQGAADYNLALSRKRADEVRKLLVAGGAKPQQIDVKGLGEKGAADARGAARATASARRVELVYR
jgi:outer membrane protein OmpA-like peptidoglycan-associated protein